MKVPAAEIVEVDSLLEAVGAALGFGVGIVFIFSLAVLGSVRAHEARLERRFASAGAWSVVAALGLAGVAAGITLGLIVMTQK